MYTMYDMRKLELRLYEVTIVAHNGLEIYGGGNICFLFASISAVLFWWHIERLFSAWHE